MTRIASVIVCMSAIFACQDIQSQKEIIETTNSGYRYELSKDVSGETLEPGQYALIHYVLSHQDTVLADTRKNPGRPTIVKIDAPSVRRGSGSGPVQDLLELLSVGDSARLYYPVDSFPAKPQRIQGYKEITYDISVVDIFRTEEEMRAYETAELEQLQASNRESQRKGQATGDAMRTFYEAYKAGQKDDMWQTADSGLRFIILERSGTGINAGKGDFVRADYYGILESDGQKFDSSYDRGQTLDFTIGAGEVIEGMEEAFQIIEKGDKAIIFVPSELAYGSRGYPGAIPPNAALFFYLEFVGIGTED